MIFDNLLKTALFTCGITFTSFLLSPSVFAGTINIVNHSFETPAVPADGNFNTGTATAWTESGGTIGYFNPNNNFYSSPDIIDTGGTAGVLGDMDGTQALFFADNSNRFVTQTLTENIVLGTTYTLTVAVGDRDNGGRAAFAGYDIGLFAGGIELTRLQSTVSPGDGTFTDVQLSYTAQVGDSGLLEIQIGTFDSTNGRGTDFDNVRLEDGNDAPSSGGTISITSPTSRQIIQRMPNNLGSLQITGNYSGTATLIEARATAIDSSGFDQDWTTIQDSPTGGTFTGGFTLQGGWYIIDVRSTNSAGEIQETTTLQPVGIGDIFITTGQSNAANFGESQQSADDDRVSYFNIGGSWGPADDRPNNPSVLAGTGGAPWPELGDLIATAQNVPVGFISIADGGSSVTSWLPSSNDNYPNLQSAVQAFGSHGFKAILWHQGERDNQFNNNSDNLSPAEYTTRLETVIASSRTDAGWNIPWGIAKASFISAGIDTMLLGAQQDVIDNDPNVFLGASTDELNGINPADGMNWRHDGVHFSNAGLEEHAARWFTALAALESQAEFKTTNIEFTDNIFTLEFTGTAGRSYQLRKSLTLNDGFPTIVSGAQGPLTLEGVSSGSLSDPNADQNGTLNRAFYVVEQLP